MSSCWYLYLVRAERGFDSTSIFDQLPPVHKRKKFKVHFRHRLALAPSFQVHRDRVGSVFAMSGWDVGQIYFSDQHLNGDQDAQDTGKLTKEHFKGFIREFTEDVRTGTFLYREQLKNNIQAGRYVLNVNTRFLSGYNEDMAANVMQNPTEYIPMVRCCARFCDPRP